MLSSNRGSGVSLLASRGRSGKKTPRARQRRTNRGRRRPTTTSNATDDDRRLANASSGTGHPANLADAWAPGRARRSPAVGPSHINSVGTGLSRIVGCWETKGRESSAVFGVAVVAGNEALPQTSKQCCGSHGLQSRHCCRPTSPRAILSGQGRLSGILPAPAISREPQRGELLAKTQ